MMKHKFVFKVWERLDKMGFGSVPMDYGEVGSVFEEVACGLKNLSGGRPLDGIQENAFRDIASMIRKEEPEEIFLKYREVLTGRGMDLEINSNLVKLLERKELTTLELNEISLYMWVLMDLAGFYYSKMKE